MAERLTRWEATCLAHLRAHELARGRQDSPAMVRHLGGLLAMVAKGDPERVTEGPSVVERL